MTTCFHQNFATFKKNIGDLDVIISCLTSSTLSFWQTHLPDATADDTSLYPSDIPKAVLEGAIYSYLEKLAETQTSIWLASHLVRAPNS